MNILVFRMGQLGDTIAALPAFWAVREHFKQDRLTLLSDVQFGKNFVLSEDLLSGAKLFDAFLTYTYHPFRPLHWFYLARLLLELRWRRFDTLVYLCPAQRPAVDTARDRRFFQLAGIRNFIGMETTFSVPVKRAGEPLAELPSESALTLARLKGSVISVPARGQERFDLNLGETEQQSVADWLKNLPPDGGRTWVGVAPGSKMKSKMWPLERFRDVVARLIKTHDIWPIVFGGKDDEPLGEILLDAWKRGYNAAGHLGLRASAAALARCRIYLGNDTGTMHLAAAVKTPCVAVFSARDHPGRWYPSGVPQRILRKRIDCEGCMLLDCFERRMDCLLKIDVDEAVRACVELLGPAPVGAL